MAIWLRPATVVSPWLHSSRVSCPMTEACQSLEQLFSFPLQWPLGLKELGRWEYHGLSVLSQLEEMAVACNYEMRTRFLGTGKYAIVRGILPYYVDLGFHIYDRAQANNRGHDGARYSLTSP